MNLDSVLIIRQAVRQELCAYFEEEPSDDKLTDQDLKKQQEADTAFFKRLRQEVKEVIEESLKLSQRNQP